MNLIASIDHIDLVSVAEDSVDETNLYYSKQSMNKSCCF